MTIGGVSSDSFFSLSFWPTQVVAISWVCNHDLITWRDMAVSTYLTQTTCSMALEQKARGKKRLVYDHESEQLHYKLPWKTRFKRTFNNLPPVYNPADYQLPKYQPTVSGQPADKKGAWWTGMSVSCMLGVTESTLWHCTADICGDDEEKRYLETLAMVQQDARALRVEVMFCARLDLINRFMAAHDFLCDSHGLDYAAPEFQTEYLDNLWLCAVSFKAYKVMDYLVECAGGDLPMVPSNTRIFHGGTTLHVAIIQGCPALVRMVMASLNEENRLKLMNTFGDGDFFPTNASCYSVPLLLALQTGQMEIFLDLVNYGADPTVKDPNNGNGIIHAITLYGLWEPDKAVELLHGILDHDIMKRWYSSLINLNPCKFAQVEAMRMKQLLMNTENLAGYSPLTHAALHGVYPMLQALLHMETVCKHTIWSMGASSLCLYDMTEIDPTARDLTGCNRASVLELLLYERPDDDIPVLAMEPLRDLMRSKWESWKLVYICWGLWHVLSIISYTLFSIFHQTDKIFQTNPENASEFSEDIQLGFVFSHPATRLVTQINIWTIVCIYLLVIFADTICSIKLYVRGRFRWPGSGHYLVPWSVVRKYDDFNMHLTIFSTLTFLSLLQIIPRTDAHKVVTGFGIMEGWYFLLFFTRAFRHTSLFTVMTNRMFHLDLLRFSIIAFIHIMSFGSCLMILLSPNIPEQINTVFEAHRTMFLVMIGFADLGFLDSPMTSWVAKIVGVAFVVTCTVLLLNLLIAAMGDTYACISENKDCIWLKMRVRSVLILDRFFHFGFIRRRMVGKNLIYKQDSRKWILKVDNTHIHGNVCRESLYDSILRSYSG